MTSESKSLRIVEDTRTTLGVRRISDSATIPTLATAQSACFDVYADLLGDSSKQIQTYTVRDDAAGCSYKSHTSLVKASRGDSLTLHPFDRAAVPTGLVFDIPPGYSIKMYSRSGLSLRSGVTLVNGVGVIDSDYTYEVFVPLVNLNPEKAIVIEHGQRIAQIELSVVEPFSFDEVFDGVEKKTKRSGGFGSTGV